MGAVMIQRIQHHERGEQVSIRSWMSTFERLWEQTHATSTTSVATVTPAIAPRPAPSGRWRATIHHQTGGVNETIANSGIIVAGSGFAPRVRSSTALWAPRTSERRAMSP